MWIVIYPKSSVETQHSRQASFLSLFTLQTSLHFFTSTYSMNHTSPSVYQFTSQKNLPLWLAVLIKMPKDQGQSSNLTHQKLQQQSDCIILCMFNLILKGYAKWKLIPHYFAFLWNYFIVFYKLGGGTWSFTSLRSIFRAIYSKYQGRLKIQWTSCNWSLELCTDLLLPPINTGFLLTGQALWVLCEMWYTMMNKENMGYFFGAHEDRVRNKSANIN